MKLPRGQLCPNTTTATTRRRVSVHIDCSQHDHRANDEGRVYVDIIEEIKRNQTRNDYRQRRREALQYVIGILHHHSHDLTSKEHSIIS